jgi:CHAT domain
VEELIRRYRTNPYGDPHREDRIVKLQCQHHGDGGIRPRRTTALVEYVVGEQKSFAWLVSRDKVSYAVLPGKHELNNLVVDYVKSLAGRPSGPTATQSIASIKNRSGQVYQILLHPFERELSSFRKLIVVPDNALAYLPFETLVADPGSPSDGASASPYLVERFAIAYAPSASALAAVKAMEAKPFSKGFIACDDRWRRGYTLCKSRPVHLAREQ